MHHYLLRVKVIKMKKQKIYKLCLNENQLNILLDHLSLNICNSGCIDDNMQYKNIDCSNCKYLKMKNELEDIISSAGDKNE